MSHSYDPFCLSCYLSFRYVPDTSACWTPGHCPGLPPLDPGEQIEVAAADEVLSALRTVVAEETEKEPAGLLLSGGIDSAILAALLPRGTRAYTIRFEAPGAVDESTQARRYAEQLGLVHRIITVTWADYQATVDELMLRKRSPLHAVEVPIALAARAARADGLSAVMVGIGADSTFGGLDKLLARDWTYDEFRRRYTFLEPSEILTDPVSVEPVYQPYRRAGGMDVVGFLKTVHGTGIIQAFENAFAAARARMIAPYERLRLRGELDLARIRRGDSKYQLRQLFARLYGSDQAPEKVAFARPMDVWLADYPGPRRPEFRRDIPLPRLSGEQRWLLYCLERFLDGLDSR